MAFKKGKSGNPQGRPKGSKGKAPAALLERVKLLVDDNMDQIKKDLKNLPPTERVRAIIKLLEFVLPKQSAGDYKLTIPEAPRQMTHQEAREFIKQLEEDF